MLHSVPSTSQAAVPITATVRERPAWPLRSVSARSLAGLLLLEGCVLAIVYCMDGLALEARLSLSVFVGALIAWVVLRLPDMPVALAGALALVVFGAVDEDALFATLGNEIVWLLIAAFIIAPVLRSNGTAERMVGIVLSRCGTVSGVFWGATLVIGLSAFVIPSTSARAAILMPLFVGLSGAIDRPSVSKGLALLFPSVILLSARLHDAPPQVDTSLGVSSHAQNRTTIRSESKSAVHRIARKEVRASGDRAQLYRFCAAIQQEKHLSVFRLP